VARSSPPEGARLRDDLEVVVAGDRVLAYLGNHTYELSVKEAPQIAHFIELYDGGQPVAEIAALLNIPRATADDLLANLADLGCFAGDFRLSERDERPITGDIGFVGFNATTCGMIRRLPREGCTASIADWRIWTAADARGLPGSEAFVGQPRSAVADRMLEPGRVMILPGIELLSDDFTEWVARQSIVVASPGGLSPATQELVNQRCGERRIPWLGIRDVASHTDIGPAVRPPDTPCYVCVTLRTFLNRSVALPPEMRSPPKRQKKYLPSAERAEITAILGMHELHELASPDDTDAPSHITRLDWRTNESTRLPALKLPNCPGCEWW